MEISTFIYLLVVPRVTTYQCNTGTPVRYPPFLARQSFEDSIRQSVTRMPSEPEAKDVIKASCTDYSKQTQPVY
jgi:hypothetical protein